MEQYGTFKVIKEYTENYGDFDLNHQPLNCYLTLYHHIIYENVINSSIYEKLQDETDETDEEDEEEEIKIEIIETDDNKIKCSSFIIDNNFYQHLNNYIAV